jgi:leucyl aminopeptidase
MMAKRRAVRAKRSEISDRRQISLRLTPQQEENSVLVAFAYEAAKSKSDSKRVREVKTVGLEFHSLDIQKAVEPLMSKGSFSGKKKEVVLFRGLKFEQHSGVMIVGLGRKSDLNHEVIRHVSAVIFKKAKEEKLHHLCVQIDGLVKDTDLAVRALVEGFEFSSYEFNELKSNKKPEVETIKIALHTVSNKTKALNSEFIEGQRLASVTNLARRWGDLPGNFLTPTRFAEEIKNAAQGTPVKVTIWDKKRIERERMGGLLGVARGSHEEPRFVIMEYKGGSKAEKPVVLVGKGLTFDSGGISIKPSAKMEEMKYDMCGGAAVAAALLGAAKLGLKLNVVSLIAMTENMPGGSATKPGDVLIARNGKSFEVNNTDAEGRLILSDALSYGSELKPKLMLDVATLTGAIVVALGNLYTGYFTRSDSISKKVEQAATRSGEWVWRMPLTDYHVEDMKGTFADLSNIGSAGGAGSATAAAFLEQFVGEGIPWVHFDIAGTAWAVGNRLPYMNAKGASGALVRTLIELLRLMV